MKILITLLGVILVIAILFWDVVGTPMKHSRAVKTYRPIINRQRLCKTALAILSYTADDQNSCFPPDLKILKENHIVEDSEVLVWLDVEAFQYFSLVTLFKYKAPRAKYFLYFPPKEEFSDDMDLSRIILAEPYPNNGERQYLTLKELTENGRPPKLPEAEFRKLAKEQGLKLPD